MSSNYSDPRALDATFPGPEQKPRGWWSRNWKWFVPTVLLCMFAICCGIPGAGIYIIYKNPDIIKMNIEPYVKAMEKIQSNPEAQAAFGQPIRDDSWMPGGNVNNGLFWDISGPKGKGKVYVRTRVTNDKWEIIRIEVTTPDDKKIIIQGEGDEAPAFKPQGAAEGEKKEESGPSPDLNPKIPMPDETAPPK